MVGVKGCKTGSYSFDSPHKDRSLRMCDCKLSFIAF